MSDAPDRETLEYKNKIDRVIDGVMELADSAKTCMEHGVYSQEIGRLEFLRQYANILSDPDWRAWLGDKPKSCSFRAEVDVVYDLSTGADTGEPIIYLDENIWKLGDRVKVTLERIEDGKTEQG